MASSAFWLPPCELASGSGRLCCPHALRVALQEDRARLHARPQNLLRYRRRCRHPCATLFRCTVCSGVRARHHLSRVFLTRIRHTQAGRPAATRPRPPESGSLRRGGGHFADAEDRSMSRRRDEPPVELIELASGVGGWRAATGLSRAGNGGRPSIGGPSTRRLAPPLTPPAAVVAARSTATTPAARPWRHADVGRQDLWISATGVDPTTHDGRADGRADARPPSDRTVLGARLAGNRRPAGDGRPASPPATRGPTVPAAAPKREPFRGRRTSPPAAPRRSRAAMSWPVGRWAPPAASSRRRRRQCGEPRPWSFVQIELSPRTRGVPVRFRGGLARGHGLATPGQFLAYPRG